MPRAIYLPETETNYYLLLITGGNESDCWYSGLIGQVIPYKKTEPNGNYSVLDPDGFIKIVDKDHAVLINIELNKDNRKKIEEMLGVLAHRANNSG